MFVTTKPNTDEDKSSVSLGEAIKEKHYGDKYTFPGHMKVIPAVIDTSGRWGDQLKAWVKQTALKGTGAYDYAFKVNYFRTVIAVAHVNALGDQMSKFLREGNLY